VVKFALGLLLTGSLTVRHTAPVHPVHAARVELTASAAGDVVAIVRVYRDDFPPGDRAAPVAAYLARGLSLTDLKGGPVQLKVETIIPEGDRLRITLRGKATGSLARGRLDVTLLQEKFPDQVNVALVTVAGRSSQLVFLKGDASQALP
jgi:hypothetical protein